MVLCQDTECSVCLQAFTRLERIPRVLHCLHTFCTPCLESLSQGAGDLVTVPCPLCRRVTCVRRCVGLKGALWVDSNVWEYIPDREEEEEVVQEQRRPAGEVIGGKGGRTSTHAECRASWPPRTKLKLPAFFKKFSLLKTQMERAMPGDPVEMRSWRRLATDDHV
ncbi:RING finger protein 224 [Gadus morhua]|uniref:RING finger protein 224 n=1 Tax=Gadus morhua TaxID=8049 RepID=UPI0011B407F0|nr:RING finger protein 224-like [Gadus morhua]